LPKPIYDIRHLSTTRLNMTIVIPESHQCKGILNISCWLVAERSANLKRNHGHSKPKLFSQVVKT
jgi:hypothetical protein